MYYFIALGFARCVGQLWDMCRKVRRKEKRVKRIELQPSFLRQTACYKVRKGKGKSNEIWNLRYEKKIGNEREREEKVIIVRGLGDKSARQLIFNLIKHLTCSTSDCLTYRRDLVFRVSSWSSLSYPTAGSCVPRPNPWSTTRRLTLGGRTRCPAAPSKILRQRQRQHRRQLRQGQQLPI